MIDNTFIDPFGRIRTSNVKTLFDSKQILDKQPLYWDEAVVSGSGGSFTYNADRASTTIGVSANTACRAVRQTLRRFNYQPGKGQLIQMTGVLGNSKTGITKRIGYYDDNNGVFFELNANGLCCVVRTKTSGQVVDTKYYQEDWNENTLEGGDEKIIVLDTTKTQIFHIDFEWLGVGTVRFGMIFDGVLVYTHKIHNANLFSNVYMSTPNLPARYEIIADGTNTESDTLTHICTTIGSEGGVDTSGFKFSANRGSTAMVTANNDNIYPVMGIRLKSTHLSSTVKIEGINTICTSTAAYAWYLLLNPTITGTALTYAGVNNTSVEISKTNTNATTVSGGILLASGVAQSTNDSTIIVSSPNDYTLGSKINGTRDEVILAVQRLTGTAETFYSSITWLDQQ